MKKIRQTPPPLLEQCHKTCSSFLATLVALHFTLVSQCWVSRVLTSVASRLASLLTVMRSLVLRCGFLTCVPDKMRSHISLGRWTLVQRTMKIIDGD